MADLGIVRVAANTVTGFQQITQAGLGTVRAAMLSISAATADGDANPAMLVAGFTDGVTQRAAGHVSAHAKALPDAHAWHRGISDGCLFTLSAADGTVTGRARFNRWVDDGVEIEWTQAPPSPFLMQVFLFAGPEDLHAKCGEVTTPAAVDTGTVVSDVGFSPQMFVTLSTWADGFDDVSRPDAILNLGLFALRLGTGQNRTVSVKDDDAGAVSNQVGNTSNQHVVRSFNSSGVGISAVELGALTATGFTATTRLGAGSNTLAYLALNFGAFTSTGGQVVSFPTVAGNKSEVSCGIRPRAVLTTVAINGTSTTPLSNNARASVIGLGGFTKDRAATMNTAARDNVATTGTISSTNPLPFRAQVATGGALGVRTSFVSLDTLGFTLNWTELGGFGSFGFNFYAIAFSAPAYPVLEETVNIAETVVAVLGQRVAVDETLELGETIAVRSGANLRVDDPVRILEDTILVRRGSGIEASTVQIVETALPKLTDVRQWHAVGKPIVFDLTRWRNTVPRLECQLRTDAGTVLARLYDETIGTEVADSLFTSTAHDFELLTSKPLELFRGHTYRVQVGAVGSDFGELRGATLLGV